MAPFSGALHERLGERTVLLSGMAVCVAALMLLSMALTGVAAGVHGVMISLAVFGAGLGMFVAPNNSATMSAAPRDRSGEAGGLLNLMRVWHQRRGRGRLGGAFMAARGVDGYRGPHAGRAGRGGARRSK